MGALAEIREDHRRIVRNGIEFIRNEPGLSLERVINANYLHPGSGADCPLAWASGKDFFWATRELGREHDVDWMVEHGFMCGGMSAYPSPELLQQTWKRELAKEAV